MRKGFTLIEVMVAVVIISTVIMALLEMYANNTHIFSSLKQKTKINQHATFFLANPDFGLENDEINLYELLEEFKLEDDLRRKLKNIKAEVIYQELDSIDLSQFEEDENDEDLEIKEEQDVNSKMVFEVGKTILKTDVVSIGYLRLRIQ